MPGSPFQDSSLGWVGSRLTWRGAEGTPWPPEQTDKSCSVSAVEPAPPILVVTQTEEVLKVNATYQLPPCMPPSDLKYEVDFWKEGTGNKVGSPFSAPYFCLLPPRPYQTSVLLTLPASCPPPPGSLPAYPSPWHIPALLQLSHQVQGILSLCLIGGNSTAIF